MSSGIRKPPPPGIRKLPSGRYQARYVGPDRKRRSAPITFRKESDARRWLARTTTAISDGTWTPPERRKTTPTLREYADLWLPARKVKGRALAPRTRAAYRKLLDDHVLPELGDLKLIDIDRAVVERWYDGLDDDKPTTRAHAFSLLRTILGTALDEELITGSNPARIRGAGRATRVHEIHPATIEEINAIAAAMPEHHRLTVLIAAWCQLRYGELTELRRGDVDVRRGVLRVRRGVVKAAAHPDRLPPATRVCDCRPGCLVGPTKSDAGQRDVAMPPHLLPDLKQHLAERVGSGADALLFPARRGGHLTQSTLFKSYDKARAKAGRPNLRWHDLRHTGGVLAAQSGATTRELMDRLGHSTPAMSLHYQHSAAGRDALLAARLSDLAKATLSTD